MGTWETFAGVAATLSDYFDLPNTWPVWNSFLSKTEAVPSG
jgi:hypothetical protein